MQTEHILAAMTFNVTFWPYHLTHLIWCCNKPALKQIFLSFQN